LDQEVRVWPAPGTTGAPGGALGRQRGSIYLADQKLAVQVLASAIASRAAKCRWRLCGAPDAAGQDAGRSAGAERDLLSGVRSGAEAVPAAFGVGKTSVSRRFIQASARQLARLQERSLADASCSRCARRKTFAEDTLVMRWA